MDIFDYENILLLPRKCRVESRSECDTSVELGARSFRMPVVPANMKTVVDESICVWLAQNGYFYALSMTLLTARPHLRVVLPAAIITEHITLLTVTATVPALPHMPTSSTAWA